jgi:tRNA-dihydrouridine synthase A
MLPNYPLSIAPMMDRTDRHYRYFMRQITRHTLLYTEMVTSQAIKHGDLDRLLGFSELEKPIVLQVGGDEPGDLAHCARLAEDFGYDEINLNVGCPSSRVQSGNFGACLMFDPDRVADCVSAMKAATKIPVSVKHRIGVDDRDAYEDLTTFVKTVAAAGCDRFNVHARKAWLQGLSPKENREVPPLRYEDVYQLKQDFPTLFIEINGGFITLEQSLAQLDRVNAVMIGRAAYDEPYLFAQADALFYGDHSPVRSRHEVVEAMFEYVDRHAAAGNKLHSVTRHMHQLFKTQSNNKTWKRILSEKGSTIGAGHEVLKEAMEAVPRTGLLGIR